MNDYIRKIYQLLLLRECRCSGVISIAGYEDYLGRKLKEEEKEIKKDMGWNNGNT